MPVWISLLLSHAVLQWSLFCICFGFLSSSFNEPTCIIFYQKRYKMTTSNGKIINANNFSFLMDVLLIKMSWQPNQMTIKLRQFSSFAERLNGPLLLMVEFMYFLYNYFLCLPSRSFHLILLLLYSRAIILDRLWNCFNCPLNILQLPARPLLKRRNSAVKHQNALLCIAWCKAFPLLKWTF